MHHPHDQRFKALMASCLELIAEVELERAVHVPPQRIDVAFEPRGPGPDAPELGLLTQMTAMGPGMLEYYSHTPQLARVDACIRKRLDYAHERALAAGRRHCAPPPAPRLWILCAGQPRKALRVYEARPMDGWPAGFWQTRSVDRVHFVVLRSLPESPDTLLLRLLGRGQTLRQALAELAAVPAEHVLRTRALPVMVAFRSPILQDLERSGDMNALQQAQALYSEWERRVTARAHREGIEQGIERGLEQGIERGLEQGIEEATRALLVRLMTQRFGPLPRNVSARVRRAKVTTLTRWADRVLIAKSLDDVLD